VQPARLVLDHALLSRLGPESPREDWERIFKRSGLLKLPAGESESAKTVQQLVQGINQWPTEVEPSVFEKIKDLIGLTIEPVNPLRYGARLHKLLSKMLQKSFIEVFGSTVLENTPHRELLVVRQEQLQAAALRLENHMEDLKNTQLRIEELNVQLGRDKEDAETLELSRAIERDRVGLRQLQEVQRRLEQGIKAMDTVLDRRRTWAERAALSAQAGRLIDTEEGREVAELEVEVMELEGVLQGLALAEVQEDARIRALIEVGRV
jgi:hypothetical protein